MSSHTSHSHDHQHHAHPQKKRGTRSWFVAAIFLMLIGMLVYILSLNEVVQPVDGVLQETPVTTPVEPAAP